MARFYQKGEKFNYTCSAAVGYHEVVISGALIGIASKAGASGDVIVCEADGVFELTKAAGAITQGAQVYLDSDKKVTTTAEGNTLCGIAWAAAKSDDTTCLVKIN